MTKIVSTHYDQKWLWAILEEAYFWVRQLSGAKSDPEGANCILKS